MKSLNQYLLDNEQKFKEKVYLRQPKKGIWHSYTWGQVMREARQVAQFLYDSGLKKGDRVAIYSKNCAEWFMVDFGISLAGMVSVPLFANIQSELIDFILQHAEVKLVFIGKLDDPELLRTYVPSKLPTVSLGYHCQFASDIQWSEILEKQPLAQVYEPKPEDLYTIIYSSGTSALPRGAVYTHQIIANYLELYPKDVKCIWNAESYNFLSYLPLAHVYERSAIELGSLTLPSTVSFIESLDKFAENLRQVEPSFFAAVPRIWGVFQQKIEQKIPPRKLNILLKIPFISGLIKGKIRKQLGLAKCNNCFSGAAHLPASIIEFFEKLDIFIQEGYGQTENIAYATVSRLQERCKGYVGTPRLGVEIKLGEENELLMRSSCLMKEYYKDKKATKSVFTKEGWLRTGDIVEIDEKNRVKILGRLSENFKNQKGEFIAPTPIEEKFPMNPFIEQLCLVGRELPNNLLLITLNQLGKDQDKELIKNMLLDNLHKLNAQLSRHEKINHIVVIKDTWNTMNGFLTPTLKIKRSVIETEYMELISDSAKEREVIVWQ
jgi:long-subunit acyl-CoA synthetase (AMP-forming)